MAVRLVLLLALAVPLFAAPAQHQQQSGPPTECEKPFGEGKLATDANPYSFTVTARQRPATTTDYKKTFKGAPIDMLITFSTSGGAAPVQAFALRAGLPFPVVQWQNTGDQQAKIVSCIAPQSVDTLLVNGNGNLGNSRTAVAVPLLAAWGNRNSLPVIYEMAIQGGNGQIYVTSFNGTLTVQETDYVLPKQFFQPPSSATAQRGMSGISNMNDPRFQQQGMMNNGGMMQMGGGQFGQGRRRRDVDNVQDQDDQLQADQAPQGDDDQADGN